VSSTPAPAVLQDFTVIERETKIMGCALLLSLGKSDDGVNVAEVGVALGILLIPFM